MKQYTVDPAYDVVIGYSIQFKDKNRDLYHDDNQYWHTIRSELSISEDNSFQFAVIDGEEHSAQSVEIPGMDKAVFINLGMNTRLIAIRMLNKPVVVKTKPGEQLLGETTEFQYERYIGGMHGILFTGMNNHCSGGSCGCLLLFPEIQGNCASRYLVWMKKIFLVCHESQIVLQL